MTRGMLLKLLLALLPLFGLGHALWPEMASLQAAFTVPGHPAPFVVGEAPPVETVDPQQHAAIWLALLSRAETVPPTADHDPPYVAQLAESLRQLAAAQQDVRRFDQALKRSLEDDAFEPSSVFPAGHPFRQVLQDRLPLQLAEKQIRSKRLRAPQEVDALLKSLRDYQQRPDARQEFLDSEMAEVRGYQLRFVDTLNVEVVLEPLFLQGATPSQTTAALGRIEQRLDALRTYARAYGTAGSYTDWIARESELMESTLRFVNLLDRLSEAPLAPRLQQFADLHRSAATSNTLRSYLVRAAGKACDARLPARLPLDSAVNLAEIDAADADFVTVPRTDVILVWHDKRMERLTDCPHDEFSIDQNDLRRIIVNGLGTRPPYLRPTSRSLAAQTYNQHRTPALGQWTVSSLAKLKAACEPYAKELGQNWARITECEKLSQDFSTLFAAADGQ